MSKMESLSRQAVAFVGSRTFLGLVITLFVLQAGWIALTARYPQAFDEQFHFGVIQFHAQQLTPFLTAQPPNADQYGALVRDPSYLYHYLMGLPYRLIEAVVGSTTTQIIILRLMNIAMLAGGLLIFRRVLNYLPMSAALKNVTIMFFSLLPVVTLLGAQINYDNLLIPVSGLAIWWCLRFIKKLREEGRFRLDILVELMLLCMVGGLIKYAFLPVVVGIVLALAVLLISAYHGRWPDLKRDFGKSFRSMSRAYKVGGVILLVVVSGLFVERYGVNIAVYHNVMPDCQQVLSDERCQASAIYTRNQRMEQQNPPLTTADKLEFSRKWLHQSVWETMFTIWSNFNSKGYVDYHTVQPLPVANAVAWTVVIAGLALLVRYARWLWSNIYVRICLVIAAVYILALWLQNFTTFLALKQPVAIHGRYFFLVLIPVLAMIAMSFNRFIGSPRFIADRLVSPLKVAVLAVVTLLFLQGGGFITYVVQSDDQWFWQQSPLSQQVNRGAKGVLEPLVIR